MSRPIRIAAAGDMHCSEANREQTAEAFARLAGKADLLLLAGDLTTHGEADQAQVLIDACAPLDMPVYAVLGNHDWHTNRGDELAAQLDAAGIRVLERDHATLSIDGVEVGIAGLKGFVGGFAGSHLPDFGEPLLRRVYAETTDDVAALGESLKAIAHCAIRTVVLHYAPSPETLVGEPEGIWTMLGTDRLAAPIAEHEPDLVVHGHAHAGTFEGRIGNVPVYNVSVPVLKQAFWVFELTGVPQPASALH
ncbi:MAG: metallophosphoesterase [Solirubrobacteraceae bacterium]